MCSNLGVMELLESIMTIAFCENHEDLSPPRACSIALRNSSANTIFFCFNIEFLCDKLAFNIIGMKKAIDNNSKHIRSKLLYPMHQANRVKSAQLLNTY